MDQLLVDGRAEYRRIQGIYKLRKDILIAWLRQAERLWIAAEVHGLKGPKFLTFAVQIGIDRSSAYELMKLHPRRPEILRQCRANNHWPGWETLIVRRDPDGTDGPTANNKGLMTPTWQRWKTRDDEYGTPAVLFDHLNRIYKFTCDVASSPELAKCRKFYSREQDGLKQRWRGRCWMNPPYSNLREWVRRAYEAALAGATVVALLPCFTDTAWFHDYASHATITVLRGRLQFVGRAENSYTPFGHMICVFTKGSARRGQRLNISLHPTRIGIDLANGR